MTPLVNRLPLALLVLFLAGTSTAVAQLEFERVPISYSASEPTDRVSQLLNELETGSVTLSRDDRHGYLRSLLQALDVPVSSQTLVFSKTSFQRHRITPRTPRALYFSDDVYVGWVQRGDMIELSTADPQLGAVFYTLDQDSDPQRPAIMRQSDHCLICHASTHTNRVPGHIMRSVYPDRSGLPMLASGTYRTDHTSPFRERFGGWYVTGSHGEARHMGNQTVSSRLKPEALNRESGANLNELPEHVDAAKYLSPHSDLVALMVLAHQVAMHNQITAAGFSARRTLHDAQVLAEMLDEPPDYESDGTKRRFANAAEKLVRWLLLHDENSLASAISGTSTFRSDFEKLGPFDKRGRSLRHFDLSRRVFRYPCSYLIYSDSFDALPDRLLRDVYRRLWDILSGQDQSDEFAHLTPADRRAIREILKDTKAGLPAYWQIDPAP